MNKFQRFSSPTFLHHLSVLGNTVSDPREASRSGAHVHRRRWGFILTLLIAGTLPQAIFGQNLRLTGYLQGGAMSVSQVPCSKYSYISHYAANLNSSGSVINGSLSATENKALVSACHAVGTKVLLVMFDPNHDSNFQAATVPGVLPTLVNNIKNYVTTYGYDGVDLDWEGTFNSTLDGQYEALISSLHSALGSSKIITMDVFPGDPMKVAANQIANLDQVNIMTYDNDLYASYTWHNSAVLNAGDSSKGSVQTEVNQAIAAGLPKAKLSIGLPFYTKHYTGTDAPLQPKGTLANNFLLYSKLAASGLINSTNYRWDSTYQADYLSLTGTNEFYTYNGVKSVDAFAQFAKTQGLGGIFTYEVNYEFIPSASGDSQFPLSTELQKAASGSTSAPSYTAPAITTTSPLAAGTVGTPYSLTVNSSGSTPMTWAVAGGRLPGGLALSSNGVISGTPTTAASSTFTIAASNAAGTSSSQFTLTVNSKSTAQPSSWYTLTSEQSGKCLDVTGNSTSAGTQLQQYSCTGGNNQKFQLTPVSGGYTITAKNSGLQLEIQGGVSATQNGAPVVQYPYSGAKNQIWSTHPNADGSYSISVLSSGDCIDLSGWSTTNGALIQQWACTGGSNQKWKLSPVQ